jgi:hypothetical protein
MVGAQLPVVPEENPTADYSPTQVIDDLYEDEDSCRTV